MVCCDWETLLFIKVEVHDSRHIEQYSKAIFRAVTEDLFDLISLNHFKEEASRNMAFAF